MCFLSMCISITTLVNSTEEIWTAIRTLYGIVVLYRVYVPPASDLLYHKDHPKSVSYKFDLVILGDNNLCNVYRMIDDSTFSLIPLCCGNVTNILDLVFSNQALIVSKWDSSLLRCGGCHLALLITSEISLKTLSECYYKYSYLSLIMQKL